MFKLFREMETEQTIKEEYNIWKNNSHLLYFYENNYYYIIDMTL